MKPKKKRKHVLVADDVVVTCSCGLMMSRQLWDQGVRLHKPKKWGGR